MQALNKFVLALAATLAVAGGAQAQPASPEAGRWITESGNLEVDVAPCGEAYCGTIVRVIANKSMSNPNQQMAAPAGAASPIGKKILFDLRPLKDGGWQGRIYNRENDKTYNSRLNAVGADQLKLTIYENDPAQGKVQVWRRPAAPMAQAQ
jgi:uncharacterized protein (DUF2147 family)